MQLITFRLSPILRFVNVTLVSFALMSPVLAAPEVVVTNAWIRATVAAQQTTGAFMQIAVSEDATLISVSSPAAKTSQVHITERKNDVAGMKHMRNGLPLMASGTTELKPGGAHVMLMQLVAPLSVGDFVPLTLTIQNANGEQSSVDLEVPVRPITTR